jgi:hypothetical protein
MWLRYSPGMYYRGFRSILYATIAFMALSACHRESPLERAPCPTAGWQPTMTPEGMASYCVPPGWVRVVTSNRMWTRSAEHAPRVAGEDLLYLYTIPAAEAVGDQSPFPPSLLGDTSRHHPDSYQVAGFNVVWDPVGDRQVRVETAHVTGGFIGVRDKPALLATWPVTTGDWVVVRGEAAADSTLATLRAVVQTVRVRGDTGSHLTKR